MSQLVPINFVTNLETALPCFFGLMGRMCSYDPRSASVYFSLGEGASALGLVFAALQLSDTKKRIVLGIKEWYLGKLVWILTGIGLLAVFIASIIPQIPYMHPPFDYPLFWELIGFVFFVLGPLSYLVITCQSRNIYNARRAERFYHVLLQKSSNGKPEDLEAAITIVHENLEKLIAAIKTISERPSDEIAQDNDGTSYARSLLNLLLSERIVADYIVTRRLDFLIALTQGIKNNNLSQTAIGLGFNKLVRRLFENPDSYLYSQLDYSGLSLYAPIYKILFEDSYFVTKFSVLSMWDGYGTPGGVRVTEKYIQVFLKALNTAIEKNKFYDENVSLEIASSLYALDDYVRHLTWVSKTVPKDLLSMILMHIAVFFGNDFPCVYKEAIKEKTANFYEVKAEKGERYCQSLTATYAESVAEFLGHLANMNDRTLERDRAMTVSRDILSIHDDDNLFDNIRAAFLSQLWEKIRDNVEQGHFPAILRIYIQLMYWNDPAMPAWRKAERSKLITYLNTDLKPRIIKNELMANYEDTKETVLLPDKLKFERESGEFYLYHRDNTKEVFS